MEGLKPVILQEIQFDHVPTEDEVMEALRSLEQFITLLAGLLLLSGRWPAVDQQQKIGRLLGVAVTLRQTNDAFRGISQIAVPHVPGTQVPGRTM